MKYVVDSSVAFKWLIAESDSDRALHVLDEFQAGARPLIAPDIFAVEVTHALTRAERQKRVTSLEGAQLFLDLMNQMPPLHPHLPLLPRAYEISSCFRAGAYDSLYVALAEREGCELLTADAKLIANLGGIFSFIVPLASLS